MTNDVQDEVLVILLERARQLVTERGEPTEVPEAISLITPLAELRLDSMEQVELISDIEAHFGVEIADDTLRESTTVGDICRAINDQRTLSDSGNGD
ncbi:acyl carrier protein [Rathayibacter toxicus]|uniref:Acyl carrier protein n=1 Tax=Rathayibacter toxicus TaxID=145458 RepID=A0A0C5BT21_9MICO|nr:acyl carrier protein [Rathayibacter toxicus]AJM77832.1 hypothetical protein TI83_07495 [Rathayibacter toxicus]ALS57980.1 hypothetical protein APU90_09585 [Rathayibacter toxicus]KKM44307.1 hypothetical protein VT73_10450 [Rathayibacter toxicus]PPG20336.1 acyl carrier protein [Rathayibacter toxicus]PPG45437.1 acyl carrier protein [Rathayibacter toxicus]